jgi:uncharacterized tellurite resistance protein B-like protein
MELENVLKKLSIEKKKAIAKFCIDVAISDGHFAEQEKTEIAYVIVGLLKLNSDVISKNLFTQDYDRVLSTFNDEEAIALGTILTLIAKADGKTLFSELSEIKNKLNKTSLSSYQVNLIISLIEGI